MEILINTRLRASPILAHIQKPFRFAAIISDFEPAPGLSIYYVGTQTLDTDMPRLNQLIGSNGLQDGHFHLILVHVFAGSEDLISVYAEFSTKLGLSILPCWSHEQAAYSIQESQRFVQNPERLLSNIRPRKNAAQTILHILQTAGLTRPKMRALCEHFKTLQAVCNASVQEIAALPGFSEETAAALLRKLGAPATSKKKANDRPEDEDPAE